MFVIACASSYGMVDKSLVIKAQVCINLVQNIAYSDKENIQNLNLCDEFVNIEILKVYNDCKWAHHCGIGVLTDRLSFSRPYSS